MRRRAADELAIRRYIEHEQQIDRWIARKMEAGEYAVADKFFEGRFWKESARFRFKDRIQADLVARVLVCLRQIGLQEEALDELHARLSSKPLVLIFRRQEEKLPRVTMLSEEFEHIKIPVSAHSSDYSVYIVVNQDRLAGALSIHDMERCKKGGGKELRFESVCDSSLPKDIFNAFFYEATVHFGLLGMVGEDRKLRNMLIEAREDLERDPRRYIATDAIKELTVVSSLSEASLGRDYANSELL